MRSGLLNVFVAAVSLLSSASALQAQVTGGQHAFEFLNLPGSPHLTALGGYNVAHPGEDVNFVLQNPALMRPGLHNQLGLSYNSYFQGINMTNLAYGYHSVGLNTSFLLGVRYLNYGLFDITDASGNVYGTFAANDYAVTLGASRSYGERWRYGASLKFANSKLYERSAAAVLADVGVVYTDTANLLTIGATAKNVGFTLKRYNTANNAEPLPFDLQLGLSKRFAHLPLRIMATVHHLYEWDIRYNNPADISAGNLFGTEDTTNNKSYFADKLFRHFIFAAELSFAKRVTVTVGYNHLRRGEMGLSEKKGLAGFSFGAGINLNKFQVYYGRSYYSIANANNEIGLNVDLGRIMSLGKTGERWHWRQENEDWEL